MQDNKQKIDLSTGLRGNTRFRSPGYVTCTQHSMSINAHPVNPSGDWKSSLLKAISYLILSLSLSTLAQAQQPPTNDQSSVQQTVIKFFKALSDRDSVSLTNFCTNDILLVEYGQMWNLDTLIRKAIRKNTAADFKRVNTIDFLTTSIDKHIAWATYNLHSDITREGKHVTTHWMETVVVVKEKNQWKIKVLHSTLIKRS
ncbi:MAG: nuclear transport factor 2 family protein [Cyclobacteriaceae bacterium]|nr:nuclear transport factor 2 family protein [Cyclobacteriaceae bacterium]